MIKFVSGLIKWTNTPLVAKPLNLLNLIPSVKVNKQF
jgi:hypothetical protein